MAIAIWTTTIKLPKTNRRPVVGLALPVSVLRNDNKSRRPLESAGTRAEANATRTETTSVKTSTRTSGCTSNSSGRDQLRDRNVTRTRAPSSPSRIPTAPPARDSSRFSLRTCETILPRDAPSATLVPISLLLAAERASINPEMLTHEINRTSATAAIRAKSACEKFLRSVAKPRAALASSIRGASLVLNIASGPLVEAPEKMLLSADDA